MPCVAGVQWTDRSTIGRQKRAEEGITLCLSSFWGKKNTKKHLALETRKVSKHKPEVESYFFFIRKVSTRWLSPTKATNTKRGGRCLFHFGRRGGGGGGGNVRHSTYKNEQTGLSQMEEGGWGREVNRYDTSFANIIPPKKGVVPAQTDPYN